MRTPAVSGHDQVARAALPRRAVLVRGGGLAAAAFLTVRGLPRLAGGPRGGSLDLAELAVVRPAAIPSLATFAPLVGSSFELYPATGRPVKVVLKSAEALSFQAALRGEAFTLIFEGPATPRIAQAVIPVSHRFVRPFRMFVVPVGLTRSRQEYEVVVDRRLPVRQEGYFALKSGPGSAGPVRRMPLT